MPQQRHIAQNIRDTRESRKKKLHLLFRSGIVGATLLAVGAGLSSTKAGFRLMQESFERINPSKLLKHPPTDAELAAQKLQKELEQFQKERVVIEEEVMKNSNIAQESAEQCFESASPELRTFLKAAGLAPEGNAKEKMVLAPEMNLAETWVLSGRVFAAEADGNVGLVPNQQSVWLRGDVYPSAIPLLPKDEQVFSAAREAGVSFEEFPGAVHTTNSWGLRGPEPDCDAALIVLVVGDSFTHGYGVGDEETAPAWMQKHLAGHVQGGVSVLNAGLTGTGPRQYLRSVKKFLPKLRPDDAVVVQYYSNDFGMDGEVCNDRGAFWAQAGHYLREIWETCEQKGVTCIFSPSYSKTQFNDREYGYTDRAASILRDVPSDRFCEILPALQRKNMQLQLEQGRWTNKNSLVHLEGDAHYNAEGNDVWGRELAEHLLLLLRQREALGGHSISFR